MARQQRMTTCAVALLAALLPVELLAAPYTPTLTGEKFVRDVLAAPDNGAASMRRERAMGYMDGVMDGTVGLLWCPAGQHVGHELSYLAAEQMKSLPADQLKKGAAPLVVAALAKIYPCPVKGRTS
ncbi:hypothetical protein ABIB38_002841 [Massilia sp. UYP11]|uniref:Rap1a/Tai family immunity protein n=1 Tax=Massilia sp. UYP11 TaxID=1756385 RepID=UPI003D2038DD